MSYVVLARKWRPQTFEDVIGQGHVVQTLHNAIAAGRVAHAFLFTGARGVGKTTAARLLAKALCCEKGPRAEPCNACPACDEITAGASLDVLEIDGASNTGVDDVRELRESARYLPQRLRMKIFIIDEVHMLSVSAFNALLKLLEEPPPHLKFIFATTEPHKIPITILSRCQRYDFKRIPPKVMAVRLAEISAREGITADPEALALVCRAAEGGMRDALSLLDQAVSYVGSQEHVTVDAAVAALGIIDRRTVVALTEALLRHDAQGALAVVRETSTRGFDLRELAHALLTEIRHVAVAQVVNEIDSAIDLPKDEIEALRLRARLVSQEEVHRLFGSLSARMDGLARSGEPLLTMEMAVLALCLSPPAARLEQVAEWVTRLEAAAGGAPWLPPETPHRPLERAGVAAAAGSAVPRAPSSALEATDLLSAGRRGPGATDLRDPGVAPGAPDAPAAGDDRFMRILHQLKDQRPALVSFLDVARVRVDDQRVSLHFFQPFYVEALREPVNDKALREAVRAVLGPEATVEVHGPEALEIAGESLAEMRQRERQEFEAGRLQRVKEHPAIKLAVDVFGARVREVKSAGT
jgi:DNA polymerase-3 subunit gamma/tau